MRLFPGRRYRSCLDANLRCDECRQSIDRFEIADVQVLAVDFDAELDLDEGDELHGGDGEDVVYGNLEDDQLSGDAAADTLFGGQGSDLVDGGSGNDVLFGNRGTDTLSGGSGNDVLAGGAGADLFVFDSGSGADTIADWEAGDMIQLTSGLNGSGITDFATLSQALSDSASGDAVIDLGDGNSISLIGVSSSTLSSDGFLFV